MRLQDGLRFSIRALQYARMRTWLTVFGVVIGIFVVVLLFSLGSGLKAFIKAKLSEFGTNIIEITPGSKDVNLMTMAWTSLEGRLTKQDVVRVRKIPGVKYVLPWVIEKAPVKFRGKEILGSLYGVGDIEAFNAVLPVRMESGRRFRSGDRRVVVLGYQVAHRLFSPKEVRVGNQIVINGKKFRVIGIFERKGGMGGSVIDGAIFLPLSDLKAVAHVGPQRVDFIDVLVDEAHEPEEVGKEIERVLRLARGEREGQESFAVWTSADYEQKAEEILDVVTLFLGAIGAVSLLVGGVGIMNTMFMAVTEMRKTIGILKAIGATDEDVLLIFLIQSGIIGLVGGLLGCVLSVGAVYGTSWFLHLPVSIDPAVVVGALGFSLFVGMASGLVPSWQATKISPAEALRYE